jgi:hypothetical protein
MASAGAASPDRDVNEVNSNEDNYNDDYCIIYNSNKDTGITAFRDSRHFSSSRLLLPSSSSFCPICNSKGCIEEGLWRIMECSFCNGTGEYTKTAASFMKVHPCQCINTSDRKNCPFCKQKCHHNANNKPRVLIVGNPPP